MASSSSRDEDQPRLGLILHPAKQKKQALVRKAIFDDDELEGSDSESDEGNLKLPERNISRPLYPGRSATQVKSTLDAALEEDPNIFAYDEVYDDMQAKKEELAPKKLSKPKYMDSLLKSAELRKREKDQREERKIQKERDEEGDEFADKEAFITPAYKEKLEELKKTEERARKEAAYEAALDVTRQRDLSGFYRHLLNQSVGEEKVPLHSISDRFDNLHEPPEEPASGKFNKVKGSKNRQIRQRNESVSSDEEEEVIPKDKKTSSKKDESEKKSQNFPSKTDDREMTRSRRNDSSKEVDAAGSSDSRKDESHREDDRETKETAEEEDKKPVLPKVNKVDRRKLIIELFTKRTVGQVFDEARERYLQRKAGTSSA